MAHPCQILHRRTQTVPAGNRTMPKYCYGLGFIVTARACVVSRTWLEPVGMTKRSPCRYFKASPEIIRWAVMMTSGSRCHCGMWRTCCKREVSHETRHRRTPTSQRLETIWGVRITAGAGRKCRRSLGDLSALSRRSLPVKLLCRQVLQRSNNVTEPI